jgi:hypothetical protein
LLGWSWSGALNRTLLDAPGFQTEGRKGYISEQILSSTLFRLYRILGGDTQRADESPNFALRERASLITLYLLIEAVRSMAQSPSVAEALEEGMEVADVGLTTPLAFGPLSILPAPVSGAADAWTGGRASKVVRWAFEAQGLFPPDRNVNHNAPGLPLAVDIYIPDRRPREERTDGGIVHYRSGGYVPVSLDWDGARRWQGDPQALLASPFTVPVGNRGDQPASGLRLRAWLGSANGDPASADWDMEENIVWAFVLGPFDLGIVVPADGLASTEIAIEDALADLGHVQVLVLVEISCDDDRANSDPAAMRPTAIADDGAPPTVPRHLADLVANDNNLALWSRGFPGD